MAVSVPEMGGMEATQRIKAEVPAEKGISLSMFDDKAIVQNMYQVGADGYIIKSESASGLLKAIYAIATNTR